MLTCNWRQQLYVSLLYHLTNSLIEIEPHTAIIKTNLKKIRRKDRDRKEYKESNLE